MAREKNMLQYIINITANFYHVICLFWQAITKSESKLANQEKNGGMQMKCFQKKSKWRSGINISLLSLESLDATATNLNNN